MNLLIFSKMSRPENNLYKIQFLALFFKKLPAIDTGVWGARGIKQILPAMMKMSF